jgi:glycerol uptake facilitator-like aquaporin
MPPETASSRTGTNSATPDITRLAAAEAIGAGIFTLVAVAAGILAERFSGANIGLAMLSTALAAAAAFAALARALGPAAPSCFNPALALVNLISGRLAFVPAVLSAAAQTTAAFLGAMLAHLVTNTGLVQVATQIQTGPGVWTGEFTGTALFVFVMLAAGERTPARSAFAGAFALLAVALATPSMSFANPAVTLARTLTDSFTSIRVEDGWPVCIAQLLGAVTALAAARWLFPAKAD